MVEIIYKSEYSKVCDLIGHTKPKTQDEEDYCQTCEFEHPESSAKVLSRMQGRDFTESNFKWTFKTVMNKLLKLN